MRLLLITANPAIERTPWWPVIVQTPGISAVMILTEQRPRKAGSSLWRNVRKHGPLWIPYRAFLLVRETLLPERDLGDATPLGAPFTVDRLTVESLRDPAVLAQVAEWRAGLGLSIGAPILRPELFRLPKRGTINLHLGRTPEYRGAPPGFWEQWTRAEEIGATVHEIDEGLDTGPVLAQSTVPLYAKDSTAAVVRRVEELGKIVLARALREAVTDTSRPIPQAGSGHTYRTPTLTQKWQLATRILLSRVRRKLHAREAVKRIGASALLLVVRPIRDAYRRMRATQPVRIFTYHRVTALCRDGMTISPAEFDRQLRYVQRYHDVVPLSRALDAIESGEALRRPLAVITFDDAYSSVLSNAFPMMLRQGAVGCIFATSALAGSLDRFAHDADSPIREHLSIMSWEDLRYVMERGWEVGGHTRTHPLLSTLKEPDEGGELSQPLAELSARLGITAPAMAYPFGMRDAITEPQLALARRLGYRAVLSNFGGENRPGRTTPTVQRIDLGGDHGRLAWRAYSHGFDLKAFRMRFTRG